MKLQQVYSDIAYNEARMAHIEKEFTALFGSVPRFFSVPGRTEIIGNHTDHNNGKVLCGAVSLDALAAAQKNNLGRIRIKSEGFDYFEISIDDLSVREDEINTTASLVRGIAARFDELGYSVGGFDAYITSDVLQGSGLSSSAAFEVLCGLILSCLYNNGAADAVTLAKVGQYAENVYFAKPCGLMDQMACALGGFVTIDFEDPTQPVYKTLPMDISDFGHKLCIINTGGSHADLSDDYASVRREMEAVAQFFGKPSLRFCTLDDVIASVSQLREKVSDRAVLRAIHFFNENIRVQKGFTALEQGDFNTFLSCVTASGLSSETLNQNVYTTKAPYEQGITLCIALAKHLLCGNGAVRVHGGGFAGTVQCFVPDNMADSFKSEMDKAFDCRILALRKVGATEIER